MQRSEWTVSALMWNVVTPVGASKRRGFGPLVEFSRKAFFRHSIRNELSIPVVPWIIILKIVVAVLLRKWEKMILNAMVWLGDKEERECEHGVGSWWNLVEERLKLMKWMVVSCKCEGIIEWPQLWFASKS